MDELKEELLLATLAGTSTENIQFRIYRLENPQLTETEAFKQYMKKRLGEIR